MQGTPSRRWDKTPAAYNIGPTSDGVCKRAAWEDTRVLLWSLKQEASQPEVLAQ